MKNKRKNKKVEKNIFEKKDKKRKKKGKSYKTNGEESLWITVVIHSVLCGENKNQQI